MQELAQMLLQSWLREASYGGKHSKPEEGAGCDQILFFDSWSFNDKGLKLYIELVYIILFLKNRINYADYHIKFDILIKDLQG